MEYNTLRVSMCDKRLRDTRKGDEARGRATGHEGGRRYTPQKTTLIKRRRRVEGEGDVRREREKEREDRQPKTVRQKDRGKERGRERRREGDREGEKRNRETGERRERRKR